MSDDCMGSAGVDRTDMEHDGVGTTHTATTQGALTWDS
jgi:hypothetical protein